MKYMELIAPCHFGMEAVLKREILDLGYEISKVEDGKVTFMADAPGIAQANIRKERRVAKDVVKITYPIVQWVNKNQKTINELEKLLGDVRKEEKGTVGRKYSNRTKILEGLFEDEG